MRHVPGEADGMTRTFRCPKCGRTIQLNPGHSDVLLDQFHSISFTQYQRRLSDDELRRLPLKTNRLHCNVTRRDSIINDLPKEIRALLDPIMDRMPPPTTGTSQGSSERR
jgi:hypothetical protein